MKWNKICRLHLWNNTSVFARFRIITLFNDAIVWRTNGSRHGRTGLHFNLWPTVSKLRKYQLLNHLVRDISDSLYAVTFKKVNRIKYE